MTSNPLFEEYLAFLQEGGAAMALAMPGVADRLASRGFDPDAERLVEAIAFNASKVGERRDQALLEVCELTFDVLFPHYLLPLPACAIVEFSPPEDSLPTVVPRGSMLRSLPVLGTACRFSTAFSVELLGAELRDVRYRPAPRGGWLDLSLNLARWLNTVGSDRLRLCLHGEPLVTRTLYKGLLAHLRAVSLQHNGKTSDLGDEVKVKAAGFAEEEALLAFPSGSFSGFRLLAEYFAFPEKYLFVDLLGLRAALGKRGVRGDDLVLRLEVASAPGELVVGKQHVRLNCTPVVNLFPHTADPVWRGPQRSEVPVRPSGTHLHYETYRVLQISGRSKGQSIDYPLLSEVERAQGRPYAQLFRRQHDGEVHLRAMLYDGDALQPEAQTVLTDILATNGKLPLALGVGDINALGEFPGIAVRNITALSAPAGASSGPELRRRLVAHLALGQQDLVALSALKEAVDLYNVGAASTPQRARAHKLLLESLQQAETSLVQSLHQRVPIWGRKTALVIDEGCFDNEGDLYLLGVLLNEYIALQTPLNHYSEVTLRFARSLEHHQWPKRLARHLLSES